MSTDHRRIFAEVVELLDTVLVDCVPSESIITMETRLRDLHLESIHLVGLAGRLQSRYPATVNFAVFVGGIEPGTIGDVQIGQLVEFIATSLDASQSHEVAINP